MSSSASANASLTSGISVLVADDDPMMLRMLTSFLTETGYRVSTATTLDAAIAANPLNFDWVISDIRMPGGGGAQLIEWIYLHDQRPKVVLMSGDSSSKGLKQLALTKANAPLLKPFHLADLKKILDGIGTE